MAHTPLLTGGRPLKRTAKPPKWVWLEPLEEHEQFKPFKRDCYRQERTPTPPYSCRHSARKLCSIDSDDESVESDLDDLFVGGRGSSDESVQSTLETELNRELDNLFVKDVGSPLESTPGTPPRAYQFTERAKSILHKWMCEHLDHLVPTSAEAAQLALESGLRPGQIYMWMSAFTREIASPTKEKVMNWRRAC